MRTEAAVLFEQPGEWQIVDVDVSPPQAGELLVRMGAAGLCHSDDHIATGDLPVPPEALPIAGGHEGAGTVEEVGPGTTGWEVGDRVILTFLASCGHCRWCAVGMQNLCDNGAQVMAGARAEGMPKMRIGNQRVGQGAGAATFSRYSTVSALYALRCPDDIPFDVAALTSCGVATGWGSAVNSAAVGPGDVVIVMGVGGIGVNAVQGSAHAGASAIIAVDPVAMKRDFALSVGATNAFATMEEATELARSLTNGQGADSCIMCVGVSRSEHVAQAVEAIRKAGTVVMTGLPRAQDDTSIPVSTRHLTLYQKRLQGSLFGAQSPARAVPLLLDLYRQKRLKIDELITRRYSLGELNEGYSDMRGGRNIRGVIIY